MKEKCFYAGSFDPMTKGHRAIIFEALKKYSQVIIGVGINPDKINDRLFSPEEAKDLIEESFKNMIDLYERSNNFFLSGYNFSDAEKRGIEIIKANPDAIKVVIFDGLAIDCAFRNEADVLIRGIRDSKDLESEDSMSHLNEKLAKTRRRFIRTDLIKAPNSDLTYVSSSLTKYFCSIEEYITVKDYLTEAIYNKMISKFVRKDFNKLAKECKIENPNAVFDGIEEAYSRKSYHSLSHVAYCLNRLAIQNNSVEGELENMPEMMMAIYYHDIVNVGDEDDEDKSIEKMKADLQDSELDLDLVEKYILATKHFGGKNKEELSFNEKLIADIDLAILGETPELYNIYAVNVRKDYQQYSDRKYVTGRICVLGELLKMDLLFKTRFFQEEFEEQAKTNMDNERKGLQTFLNTLSPGTSLKKSERGHEHD
jgi:cytidyltransferase-like protein